MTIKVDKVAKEIAVTRFALPECLHIPVAARNYDALVSYVGHVRAMIADGGPPRAILVEPDIVPARDDRLPIWALPRAILLHASLQLWVHVDYPRYRTAYARAFPAEDIKALVIDHVTNRRISRLKGFEYVRLVAISRGANSSSGTLSEKLGVEYHSSPAMRAVNAASTAKIQYADIADIVKMLDIKTGRSVMDPVNEAQALISLPRA